MQLITSILATASMAALANAHGYFVTPPARQPGTAFQQSCGMQAYYNMKGSINGNVQGLEQVVASQSDYNPATCHLWKCKGMKYADNTANVQKYTPGQSVDMYFDIVAPHTGVANVSIISLASDNGEIIAANLKSWSTYASTSTSIPDSEEHFTITMPSNLGSQCAKAGNCAIQMYWNAASIDQTYESCVDFTLSASKKRHARDFSLGAEEVEEEIEE